MQIQLKKILAHIPFLYKFLAYLKTVILLGTVHVSPLTPQGKIDMIKGYAKACNCRILVETGTCLGDTIAGLKDSFEKIFSIELNEKFAIDAQKRFIADRHISILIGDSGEKIHEILSQIDERAVFWLDAHYSGGETARGELDSPVMNEISVLLKNNLSHCILIDDARLFKGKDGYPKIKFLKMEAIKNGYTFQVRDDVIRLVARTLLIP